MNKRSIASFVINKSALKRIGFIYLPLLATLWIVLFIVGVIIKQPYQPLDLNQDFAHKIPIAYNDRYNIEFFGLEKYHPFDSTKYRRVFESLGLKQSDVLKAGMPDNEELLVAETPFYLKSLESSWTMARITELGFLRFFPDNLTREIVLDAMEYQVGGSLLASEAALQRGWAINLGGGFHHASSDNGGGFCALADISLIVKHLRLEHKIQRAMIIDLDAHQGNGYQRDFLGDKNVFIVDEYNKEIYPHDGKAKAAIAVKVELPAYTSDAIYLHDEQKALNEAFNRFKPDIVIYNAGMDTLVGDPLGALGVSEKGIIRRDEMVFQAAFDRHLPLVMLFGGGYQRADAPVIAKSILNLKQKFHLW
jgi:histone deacetylase 11